MHRPLSQDYDVAGQYGTMIPDAEVLKVLVEILDDLDIGKYTVKLNHRKLLDAMLDICGVPADKFRPICSAIDKLDKEEWSVVRDEMVEEKGLSPEAADRIEPFVKLAGQPRELMTRLRESGLFGEHKIALEAMAELDILFTYLEAFGVTPRFTFDLSLARGLDYYTGIIYEAVMTETNVVGSIAAGGRYDELVGMFGSKHIPAVGVSIGIERVFTLMELKLAGNVRETDTQVYVAAIGKNLLEARMAVCSELWAAGIKTQFMYQAEPKFNRQLQEALDLQVPLMVILGEDELAKGEVNIKALATQEQKTVKRADIVATIQADLETAVIPEKPEENPNARK